MAKTAAPAAEGMANKQKLKTLQVVQNFFTKVLQVIVQSRSLAEPKTPHGDSASKINKWFNLYMASLDDEGVRHELRAWKAHLDLTLFPPMIIETCLDLSQLSAHEHVVLEDDSKSVWPVLEGELREIVVERWLIKFDCHSQPAAQNAANTDELPLMYKQAIILLRTIYSLVRLLPSFKLRKLVCKPSSKNLALVNHFLDGSQPVTSKNRIGLSKSIIPQHLLGESHLTQRDFAPIVTSLGTLSVSVVYRNHYLFRAQDQEERLSSQFVTSDKELAENALHRLSLDETALAKTQSVSSTLGSRVVIPSAQRQDSKTPFRGSFEQFRERFLVLPCTSDHLERLQMSPPRPANIPKSVGQGKNSFQPFRVGSIGSSSPPHQGSHSPAPSNPHSSMVERRVSITSNRSGSNASLIALLRNPRGGTSSSAAATNMNVSGSQNHTASLARSIASSHGSHLAHEEGPGEIVGTPKFLSSFGSRQSRRFSSTSGKLAGAGHHNDSNTSYMGTSLDLGSSVAPSSGIYIDDDISSFVRMIDGKSELRLSTSSNNSGSRSSPHSNDQSSHADALNRFHMLKSQYQQLGDSVNASLVLQKHYSSRDNQSIDSRLTGSKLANSGNLSSPPPPTISPSSHDNTNLPSISSRLTGADHEAGCGSGGSSGSYSSKLPGSVSHRSRSASSDKKDVISGPVTTRPGQGIHYHDVFEDDDESTEFYSRNRRNKSCDGNDIDYDNDDLLFEMTDTR